MRLGDFLLLLLGSQNNAVESSLLAPVASSSASYLRQVPMGLPVKILGIDEAFGKCEDENKINVGMGTYRDENGKPLILPWVKEAERQMIDESCSINKEYAPIVVNPAFIRRALEFAYGEEIMNDKHIAGTATLSGTGACRIGGAF